jgi:hypothetical protein
VRRACPVLEQGAIHGRGAAIVQETAPIAAVRSRRPTAKAYTDVMLTW